MYVHNIFLTRLTQRQGCVSGGGSLEHHLSLLKGPAGRSWVGTTYSGGPDGGHEHEYWRDMDMEIDVLGDSSF